MVEVHNADDRLEVVFRPHRARRAGSWDKALADVRKNGLLEEWSLRITFMRSQDAQSMAWVVLFSSQARGGEGSQRELVGSCRHGTAAGPLRFARRDGNARRGFPLARLAGSHSSESILAKVQSFDAVIHPAVC